MDVQTRVRYVNDEWRERDEAPNISTKALRHANTSTYDVTVHDARPMHDAGLLDIDEHGFVLGEFPALELSYHEEAAVRGIYDTVVAPLVCRATGAMQTFVASHLVRTEDQSNYIRAYARFIHTDYPLRADRAREQRVLDANGFEGSANDFDFAWINVWTPLDYEVKQNPLALIDASTLDPGQCLDYRFADSPDAIASVPPYSRGHRFYYFSGMKPGEALVFKQLDSREGKATMCPHTAVIDPSVTGSHPRRSIEFRTLCLFDPT